MKEKWRNGVVLAGGLALAAMIGGPVQAMDWEEFPFTAGQHIDAGSVWVANDADYMYVKFVAAEPWEMKETHLHVATELSGIPANTQGIPVPGHFDESKRHVPTVPSYEYAIPLIWEVGQELVIAAHAEIVKLDEDGNWVQGETAWGGENVGPGRRWWRYIEYTVKAYEPGNGDGNWTVETAWAFGPVTFNVLEISQRWGWVFDYDAGKGDIEEQNLYAGAAQNDTGKGTLVGKVSVRVDELWLVVTYEMFGDYELGKAHLYVGTEEPDSAAPGLFPYKSGELMPREKTYEFMIPLSDFEGMSLKLAAHAEVWAQEWK